MKLWKQSTALLSHNPLILAMTALTVLPGQIVSAAMSRHVAGWIFGGLPSLILLLEFYGLTLMLNAVSIILFVPATLQLICDTAAGRPTDGWFSRGVKRLWWQPLVSNIILGSAFLAALIALSVVMLIATIIIALGGSLYNLTLTNIFPGIMIPFGIASLCAALIYSVLLLFSWAAVAEESSYNEALRQTFRLGFRHFFRVLGPFALFMVVSSALFLLGMLLDPLLAGEPISLQSLTFGWPALLASAWIVLPYAWLLVYVICLYRRLRPSAQAGTDAGGEAG